jgi:ATP-dependent Lon protease
MRYRQMINFVLGGDCLFGVLNNDASRGKPPNVGGCARITACEKLSDGRMNILTVGFSRFRVQEYREEKPYLVGLVEFIDDKVSSRNLDEQARKTDGLLTEVIRLSGKLVDKKIELPEKLPVKPKELSYWIAGNIFGSPEEQQELLEMTDTWLRLEHERDLLERTLKELAARVALKEAFN